jgi:hypothetical protein
VSRKWIRPCRRHTTQEIFFCSADLSEDSQEETQCVYPDCLSGAALYQNVILMILSRVGSFIFKCSLFAVFYGKCPIGPPVGREQEMRAEGGVVGGTM